MRHASEIPALRQKLMEHREAAQAVSDELADGTVGYPIECALDALRASMWPANLDMPPRRER
jgi:hypothetical protein